MMAKSKGIVLARMEEINDGDWQRMSTLEPAFIPFRVLFE